MSQYQTYKHYLWGDAGSESVSKESCLFPKLFTLLQIPFNMARCQCGQLFKMILTCPSSIRTGVGIKAIGGITLTKVLNIDL